MEKHSKIKGYFQEVSKNIHSINVMKTFAIDEELQAQEQKTEIELKQKQIK